jgi:hypothetical protein
MAGKEKQTHIIKDLRSSTGGNRSSRMYVITTVSDGRTEVVVEHSIAKRFPVQELDKAEALYEKLDYVGIGLDELVK